MCSANISALISSYIRTKSKDTMKYFDSGHSDINCVPCVATGLKRVITHMTHKPVLYRPDFVAGQFISILFDSHDA